MKTFHCDHCNQQVFFENVLCERCGHMLGYIADLGEISSFEPDDNGFWRSLDANAAGLSYKQCHNYAVERVCNRMIPLDDPAALCRSCRLTLTIPALTSGQNREYWYRLERAKRRLLYTLNQLGLPVVSRHDDPASGLAFEFLEDTTDGTRVHTGHSDGLITLNIAEADDAHREQARTQMNEPYRTLLGHFRHEIGHYYFMRLMHDSPLLEQCRTLFGDERADYGQALQRHYQEGPPAHWDANYISAYATMHPFEDWAETWAHYMHMVDTLETASACGLALAPQNPVEPSLPAEPVDTVTRSFTDMIDRWFPLTYALNSLNRSMGQMDGYPFALAPPVIDKLRFIHRVIKTHAATAAA
jgi:hypothetical protein